MMAVSQNNIFIPTSPTKAISGQGAAIRNWVKNGDLEKLESVVLDGQGARLLGLMESTGDAKVKAFLKSIPGLMSKVDLIHDAVIRGSLKETQTLIDKRKMATARDAVGRGIAHKAVLYNHKPLLEWMAKKYPETIQLKDNEGRTCLHYTAANKDPEEMYDLLVKVGANTESIDIHGRKPAYYLTRPEELDIEGPYANRTSYNNSNTGRSFSRGGGGGGGGGANNRLGRRISPISPKSTGSASSASNITRAQIRIWIHERDISKLENIVWSGNGDKLLTETTNNSKVRRFLDNVPHLLSRIKSIHTAAIHNDVNSLKVLKEKTSDIEEVFTAKDAHGLTPFHKAAGLGNRATVEYLLYENPAVLNELDNEGRSPLHYASRDPTMYNFLARAGADENVVDSRGKTPGYYKTHPNDLDTKHLRNIPDAPRVSGDIMGWERGISPLVGGVAAATAINKRKISTGEFSGGSSNGQGDIEDEPVEPDEDDEAINHPAQSPVKSKSSLSIHEDTTREGAASSGLSTKNKYSGTKFRRTDESGDEIEDVNDGYVADSDEGKYEMNAEYEMQPMEEDEDEELDKELQAIGNDESSSNQTPNDMNLRAGVSPAGNNNDDGRLSALKSAAGGKLTPAEVARGLTPEESIAIEGGGEGISDVQEPKMEDEVPEQTDEESGGIGLAVPDDEIGDEGLGAQLERHSAKSRVKTPGWSTEYPSLIQDDESNHQQKDNNEQMETSQGGAPDEVHHDVDAYLRTGDMEKLVEMVLDGKGGDLIGRDSSQQEVQEFLVNVPAYMAKIASIHSAAGTGNLRDLQSLLDRKRLAQAKDEVGRVPLHHAVLNGHSNVTRYLASNYPQSLSMVDVNKRSPLHYAAVLPDQGALFKVLIQAGADPNMKDVDGNTPGIYLRRKDLLTQGDLFQMTAANSKGKVKQQDSTVDTWERPPSPPPGDPEGDSLERMEATGTPSDTNDNDVTVEQNFKESLAMEEDIQGDEEYVEQFPNESEVPKELRQFPAIWSEEGKYLASVLGDALVKGLTQVSQERPDDPVEYLANFLKRYGGEKGLAVEAAVAAAAAENGNMEPMERLKTPRPNTPAVAPMVIPVAAPRTASKTNKRNARNTSGKDGRSTSEEKNKEEGDTGGQEATSGDKPPENEKTEQPAVDQDEEELMQRLEDAADDEADAKALDEEDDDENGIQTMDDPDDGDGGGVDNTQSGTRDDRGQSVLHFAAARPGGSSTILAFLQNPSVNLAWRDERLRTARDIALGMERKDNLKTIDSWIVSLAVAGDKESLESLVLDGYDHLTDVEDSNGTHVIELAEKAGKREVGIFLRSIPDFNERLLKLHRSVRNGDLDSVKNLMMRDHRMAIALSPQGRTALHVAVLMEEYEIVKFICQHFPESLKRGDNLERTPLHYAMGVEKVEKMTRILVRNGAKRVVKDLRGRQPSYYFINRDEISMLQKEEEDLKATGPN